MKHELDESTLEVIKLIQDRNRKKQEKAEMTKAVQNAFIESAKQFIADSQKILTPLNPYGITCLIERSDVTHDFGDGEKNVELETLIIKDGTNTIARLQPFSSKARRSDGLRFRMTSSKSDTFTILKNPLPSGEYMGWHMWLNENDRSAEPEYLKMDKRGLMTIVKDYLLADDN
jgi:hypothetical protein